MNRLHYHVEQANYDEVIALIEAGVDVNTENGNLTPLDLAIHNDDPKMVELLIQAGADVNHSHPKTGKRPLHDAVTKNLRIMELLFEAGADVEGGSETSTPLCTAAAFRKREAYDRLIAAGANPKATMNGVSAEDKILRPSPFELLSEISERHRQKNQELDAHAPTIKKMMEEYRSVEEYAAHRGRHTYVFGLHTGTYSEPDVAEWARRYAEIISSRELLTQCEEEHLSGPELERARRDRRRLQRWLDKKNAKAARIAEVNGQHVKESPF